MKIHYKTPETLVINGDCRDVLPMIGPVDAVVTDPPYGLKFMGQDWDHGLPGVEFWKLMLKAMSPGAHLLAFGGTRTFHRLACAIEDAGFELRDCIMWVFGTGWPKSLNISKALAKATEAEQEVQRWEGWGTSLSPSYEPVIVARKPLEGRVIDNVLKHGTGGINVDACRVAGGKDVPASPRRAAQNQTYGDISKDPGTGSGWDPNVGRWPGNLVHDSSEEVLELFPELGKSGGGSRGAGGQHGRYGKIGAQPDVKPGFGDSGSAARFFKTCEFNAAEQAERSRLFYCPKASRKERGEGNDHKTVKPLALMRWLVRMVTPPGGLVLDPFMGSGTTLLAARAEGIRSIGIEAEENYCEIAAGRLRKSAKDG